MDCHISDLIWTDWNRTWNRSVVANHNFLKCIKKGKTTTLLLSKCIIFRATEGNFLCYTCNSAYWFLSLKLYNFLMFQTLTPLSYSWYFWSPSAREFLQWSSTAPSPCCVTHCTNTLWGNLQHSQCPAQSKQSCSSSWGLMASAGASLLSSGCFSDPYMALKQNKPFHARGNTENLLLDSTGPCSGDVTTNVFGHVQ